MCSGWLLHTLVKDSSWEASLETFKGWFFIAVTALLLGLALDRYFRETRQSAQLLRESEERLKQLVAAAQDAIIMMDPEGRIALWNQSATRVFGYSADEALGQPVHRLLSPSRFQAAHENGLIGFRRTGTGATVGRVLELTALRKDGSEFPIELSVSPLQLGGAWHAVGILRDISDRKRTEEKLRFSEERYRNLVETTFDIIWEMDADARFTYASPRAYALLGYTPEEVLGRTPFDFMPETESQRLRTVFQSIAANREPFSSLESINRHKDGRLIVLETSGVPVWGANAEFKGYRGMDRDVTERKRVETELKASEERFRTVVELAPEAIFIRTDLRFVYLNPAALSLFGASSGDQLLGQSVLDRFQSDSLAEADERVRRLDERGESTAAAERVLLRLDGSPVHVSISSVPFHYQDQKCVLVFARDVTELKRLEVQLRQAQKLEAVGQLAGGVAHDFNNILAAIMMHLGLLQMNPNLDAETRQALEELDAEAQRAATLTRQLLMFSRRSVLAMKPLDLNEVVTNLLKMLNRLIGEHIDLRFESRAGLPLVDADAGMLEQVLMNLVVNARDAMPKGGRIAIRTAMVDFGVADTANNAERRPGCFVCLGVADTGCGMHADTLKRIFEPFFTTKEAGKGTGLGLATVHGIIAQHKGWVEVKSQVGQGTTFTVFLPALAVAAADREAVVSATPARRGHETILLVEDDPAVRRTTGHSLRALGYNVFDASNGKEAMALWQIHGVTIDLLLTDMVMPEGMTGLELMERLQALKPGLKTIISSGYSAEMVQTGMPTKEGVVYLPKPYESRNLAEVVRNCLDRTDSKQS